MRYLLVPILWIAALLIAFVIFRRIRRGRKVVLTGRFSPRLIRMIVVILVVLGIGEEKSAPTANAFPIHPSGSANDQLPATINENIIQYWLNAQVPGGQWQVFKKGMAQLTLHKTTKIGGKTTRIYVDSFSPTLGSIVRADVEAHLEGKEPPLVAPAELLKALDEMEKYGFYDHWLNAYLWRKSAGVEAKQASQLVNLYKRLSENARVADTLIAAHAQVRPLMQPPRAWMSKAGPRPQDRVLIAAYQQSMTDMVAAAKKLYPTVDEGTWRRDGQIQLSPAKNVPAPTLIHAGKLKGFPEGETTRLGRLDLIETPKDKACALEHEWLGKIELPVGRVISVWQLPSFISKDAEDKLRVTIKSAIDGDEKAADRLEKVLPLAHVEIRAALKETPKAKGAPRLRMILALFDDALMPVLPQPQGGLEELGPFGSGGGFGPGGGGFGPGGGG
jgi:hypothetical protein